MVTNLPANAGDARDLSLIPGSGRPPGGGNHQSLQYSCLEKSHGQRRLAGYGPWGGKESDMTRHGNTPKNDSGKCLKARRPKNLEKLTLVCTGTSFLHHRHHEVKQS